jgi:hypothetical protein
VELRPYQKMAVEAVYDYLRNHDDNPCVVIPTAGGKTPVMATICKDAVGQWNGRVLILAHVKELLEQAADKLRAICPEIRFGVYSAGLRRRDTEHAVIVAGVQSVYKRACDLDAFDLVIVDEAHMIPPEGEGMYRQFLTDAKVINPRIRTIGLTATPYRLKSGMICGPENMLNTICYEIGVRELIRDGYLCPLVSKAGRDRVDTANLHIRGGEFIADELEELMDQDQLVESACAEIVQYTQDRRSVLIFASGIKHARHIQRLFREKYSIECGFVCGKTPGKERDETLARFRSNVTGELFQQPPLKYLVNVNVLTMGFDSPTIDCIALLRPTLSPGLFYQMCLDMETEVLVPEGWARCSQVKVGDTVGAFDLQSGNIIWTKAQDKIHRQLQAGESLYGVRSPHLDVRVTNHHVMIYRGRSRTCKHWRKAEAEQLAKHKDSFYVPIAGTNDGSGLPLSDDEIRFVGWALTDGHRSPKNNSIVISQSAASPYNSAIVSMLRGCGFGYRVYRIKRKGHLRKYPDCLHYMIPYGKPRGHNCHLRGWKSLAPYFDNPVVASMKDISRRQLGVLLEAMNLGDGAKPGLRDWTPRTITLCIGNHKFLADQLQSLFIRRGYRCNISSQSQKTAWNNKAPQKQYLLRIRPQITATIGGSNSRPSRIVRRRCTWNKVPHLPNEWVWCLTTEHGTLVTRRNGKVCIVGNCGRGFRLHSGKENCLVLDFGGNVLRHGPVDQIRMQETKAASSRSESAPAKQCPECHSVIAAGYAACPDCGYEFPRKDREPNHDAKASTEGILSGQASETVYQVRDVFYSVHYKRGADESAPRSMRVDYRVGFHRYKSEWVCFEHQGYPRRKAELWWQARSNDPIPSTTQQAVDVANAGGVASTISITVRTVAGEKFDRIVDYELGAKPDALPTDPLPLNTEEIPF